MALRPAASRLEPGVPRRVAAKTRPWSNSFELRTKICIISDTMTWCEGRAIERQSGQRGTFWAQPALVTDLDQAVTLCWSVSDLGKDCVYGLRSDGGWQPRDCVGADDCFTWQEGAAGVGTPPLAERTTFFLDVIAHGHVTPGGGFQGGIMLATGLHLLYVAGRYRSLEQLRPLPLFQVGEAAGTAAFAAIGLAGLAVGGSFLALLLPTGTFGQLLSAGSVPLLDVAVGVAVGSGGVVLLAQLFRQVFLVSRDHESSDPEGSSEQEAAR